MYAQEQETISLLKLTSYSRVREFTWKVNADLFYKVSSPYHHVSRPFQNEHGAWIVIVYGRK